MKRILMLASAGLPVVALVLVATTPAVAAGYRSEGAAAKPPRPPDAATVRLVETKLGDELVPMLGRGELVGVIVFLADQPSLEITAVARSFYQPQWRGIDARIRALAAGDYRPLPPGATRDQVRAAARREYAAMTDADRAALRGLTAEARELRRRLRDEVIEEVRGLTWPQQQSVADDVAAVDGRVLYHYTTVNALAARVPGVALAGIADRPGVAYVVADRKLPLRLNTSAYSMRADTFWSNGFDGGLFTPGIVDAGVDTTHPALTATTWSSRTFHASAQTQTDYADNPSTTDDLNGHGTHVAGIAVSGNTTYKGVAYGSAQALNLKAGYNATDGSGMLMLSDVMAAVDWALTTSAVRPDVLNFSAGGLAAADDSGFDRFWDAIVDDADAFTTPAAVAAGNAGPDLYTLNSPGVAYNLLCVAAANDNNTSGRGDDLISAFSSRGPTPGGRKKPDLTAPGQSITSCNNAWEGAGADFVTMSGTSMASPHVAGAVLLLADAGILEPMRQKAVLINASEDRGSAGWDPAWGWGYLDMWYAYYHRSDSLAGFVYPAGSANAFRLYRVDGAGGDKFTLAWDRHVNYSGASYPGTYYSLSDLDLRLYAQADNAVVSSSISSGDNVEQVVSNRAGSLVIKVNAYSTSFAGVAYEDFALAGDEPLTVATGPQLNVPGQPAYTPLPGQDFLVTVNVANQGDLFAHGCSAQLAVPAGITLVSGANPQPLGAIPSGAGTSAAWTLRVDTPGTYSIGVTAASSSYGESWGAPGSVKVVADTPRLTGGGCDPSDPAHYGAGTIFRFRVHYYHPAGTPPSAITVAVDDAPHAMTLATGSAFDGDYEYSTPLPLGTHTYYFWCDDGAGHTARLPDAGTLAGPFLCRALINDNAPWTSTPTVNARIYARGASEVYLKNTYAAPWQGPYAYTPGSDSTVIAWTLAAGSDGPRAVYAMCQTADAQPSNTSVDVIDLDSTAAPIVKSVTINSGAAFTVTPDVTVTVYPDCATDVRFKNRYADPWGSWQPLSRCDYGQFARTLAAGGDGPRVVYVQARDHHGLLSSVRYDSIDLDTTAAPIIKGFNINGNAPTTISPNVALTVYPDCAASVRFKNRYADPWGSWQSLSQCNYGQFAWTLAAGADGARAVYAQVQDRHGNLSALRADTIELFAGG
ncbi:MAG TPA: S8 family serine peptidase [Armatimonadota bacterium]|nr:S8 family serine peptidase [Armatimonadota bacterium]